MAAPYDSNTISTVEDLLEEVGGMNKFQMLLIAVLYVNLLPIGWSTQQMTFADVTPEWYCATGVRINKTKGIPPHLMQACTINNTYTRFKSANCGRIRYLTSSVTIVTEWDLVCDLSWVKKTVNTVEMGGSLIGALLAGQSATIFGRRKITYVMVAFHAVMNFITGFSMAWQMFAVCRFFIGVGIGAVLVLVFPYPMEFVPIKWRAFLAVIPSATVGISVFAGIASAVENWSYLHLICGLFVVPGIFGYIFIPESARWLTVTGRLEHAEFIYEKIASVNETPLPPNTGNLLQKIYQKEIEGQPICKQYSYVDIFKDRDSAFCTLTFGFIWFSFAMAYHTVLKELSDLQNDEYLNIFLLAVVEFPLLFASFFTNNTFGRRLTALSVSLIYSLMFLVCLIVSTTNSSQKGSFLNGLCLTAKIFMGAGWAVLQTWSAEFYPTVTRFLGYGLLNSFARLAFMLGPTIMDVDDRAVATYAFLTVLCLVCFALVFTLPETKDINLNDSLILQADTRARLRATQYQYQIDEQPESNIYQETSLNNASNHWTCQENHVGLTQHQAVSSIHLDVLRNQMTFGDGGDVTGYNNQSYVDEGMGNGHKDGEDSDEDNAYCNDNIHGTSCNQFGPNKHVAIKKTVDGCVNYDHAKDAYNNKEDSRDDNDDNVNKQEVEGEAIDDKRDAINCHTREDTETMAQTAL